MSKFNLKDFRDAVENVDGEYYGYYEGRFFFKGYAAVFDNQQGFEDLAVELAEMGMKGLTKVVKQRDQLGLRFIIAFDSRAFNASTDPQNKV